MEPNATARRILMVDDEERNLLILEGILAPVQYTLNRATTGQEAMEKVLGDPPDLILLDVMMPGLSGFDVCRHLKSQEETRFIPILLVTALSDKDSKIQGAEAGDHIALIKSGVDNDIINAHRFRFFGPFGLVRADHHIRHYFAVVLFGHLDLLDDAGVVGLAHDDHHIGPGLKHHLGF